MAMKFERYIVFTPTNFTTVSHAEGQVLLELDVSDKDLGIAPGLGLMIAMFPHDARKLAGLLYKKADAAEGIANLQS